MKVLHISGARSWGGNEQQLVDLLPELNKLGVENAIFGMENSPLHSNLQKTDFPFLFGQEKKIHKKGNFPLLKKIVREQNPDVIHLHTSDSATLFVLADLFHKLKTPAVLSKKGMGNSMSFLSRYKYNYENIKKTICVSKAVKSELEQEVIKPKNHHKLEVVYDGVNLDRTKVVRTESIRELFGISKDALLLGNIANHAKAKDLGVLVKMMNHLVNVLDMKNVHLVQLGEFSKLTDELKAQIEEHQLGKYISLAGFQDHALDFIPQFDIYVMSSQREGLPITIFEAFYKKTPVVSTRAGGIPEAITNGENGFLADVGDHETLASKVAELSKNSELQKQFVERSEEIFYKNFLAGITAEKTHNIYKNLIKN